MTIDIQAHGIAFYFDKYRNNYPQNINIKWYNDDTLLDDKDYVLDNSIYFCQNNVNSYNKIVVTFANMNKPYTYLKIFNIEDGQVRYFYKDELISLSISEEISSTSETLTINTFDFNINNKSNIDLMFIRTRPLYLYKDNILIGTFFIDKSSKEYNYKVSAIDYIGMLEYSTYLGGMYAGITASTLISDILGDIPYELETALGEKIINGYLAVQTKRLALQQVAFNIGAVIDCSRTDKIIIKHKETIASGVIGNDRIISKKETNNAIITKIEVTEHSYVLQSQVSELFNGTITGLTTILFSMPASNLVVSGATLVTSGTNYAIVEGTGNNVTISGYTYQDTTKIISKNNVFTSVTDLDNVKTYNSTLTNSINSQDVLNNLEFIQKYYDISYVLGDEKVGDVITIDNIDMRIISIDYDIDSNNLYGKAKLEVL